MKLLRCMLSENDCFKQGETITPRGVMIHSTGADNPMLRRYVQPAAGDRERQSLLAQLGDNPNGNDWNRPGLSVCVHGFVGKLADGSVACVQTLPWNCRGWHAGNGTTRPSANNTHISVEICEDGLDDPEYFGAVYRAAVELTAHLCTLYGLDPLEPGVIVCHSEGYRLGMASNHADVEHWFPRFDKSMRDFRADVEAETEKGAGEVGMEEKFDRLMERWLRQRITLPPSAWSKVEREWAEGAGIFRGDGEGNMNYRSFCTREELAVALYRVTHPKG